MLFPVRQEGNVTFLSQMIWSGHKFEALLYSAEPGVVAQCASSFENIPGNWISFQEPEIAARFLAEAHFDFVVLDLDCVAGKLLLERFCHTGRARQSVVFAVTSGAVDPDNLALCYEYGVFYPVHPSEVRANLDRNIPLAERLAQDRVVLRAEAQNSASDNEDDRALPPLLQEVIHTSKVFAWVFATVVAGIMGMRHSLGIATQERVASLLSAVASIWFVQETTANFRGLLNVAPPSAGPMYLLALSLLLWLCAKKRRISSRHNVPVSL